MNFTLKLRVGLNPQRHDDGRKVWAVLDWTKKPGEDTVDCLIVLAGGDVAQLRGVPVTEFSTWPEVEFTGSVDLPRSTE